MYMYMIEQVQVTCINTFMNRVCFFFISYLALTTILLTWLLLTFGDL